MQLSYLQPFLDRYLAESAEALCTITREGEDKIVSVFEKKLRKLSEYGCVYASVLHLTGYLCNGSGFTDNHFRFLTGTEGGIKMFDQMLDDLFVNRSLHLFQPQKTGAGRKEKMDAQSHVS